MKTSTFIICGLFFGASGAIAATLYASCMGAKTRKETRNKKQEFKDFILENYNDIVDTCYHPLETLEAETER